MKITGAKVYGADRKFHDMDLYVKDGKIAGVLAPEQVALEDGEKNKMFAKPDGEGDLAMDVTTDATADEEILDGSGCYAIPGLVDIHFHGAMGADVCDGTSEAFETIAKYEASRGITAICPATLTLPVEDLKRVLSLGAKCASGAGLADLVGFNMEGPFISHAKKGAQNEEYIRSCDAELVKEFVEASKGLLKIIGLAPEENPGFESYISAVRDQVKVSLAHTNADYDTAMKAFAAGASHAVHLYNAMTGLNHREPGVVGAVFDSKNVTAELICDGVHIHPAVVRTTFEMLGPDRVVMISDSLRAAGMPDGEYELGGLPIIKKGKEIRLAEGGSIAGSCTDLMGCLKTAVREMGIPLEDAVAAATINPARCISVDDKYGSLEVGKLANIVLLGIDDLEVKRVIRGK